VFSGEELLVNPQNLRRFAADPLARQQPEISQEPALDGGAGNALTLR
jgi:hypothetical protein